MTVISITTITPKAGYLLLFGIAIGLAMAQMMNLVFGRGIDWMLAFVKLVALTCAVILWYEDKMIRSKDIT